MAKKLVPADEAAAAAEKTGKKAQETVENKKVAAEDVEETVAATAKETDAASKPEAAAKKKPSAAPAKPTGSSVGYRIAAIILWCAGLGLEIVAILILLGKININLFRMTSLTQIIVFLVLDLICVVIGSQLWKKANHISPISGKNKTLFWIWNNMGLIVSVACFLPFIILCLSNKNADKKTKVVATVVAIIALLIAGVAGIDFNPVSKEDQQAAIETITGDVYWAPFGKVYHTHDDCQSLNHTDTLTYGSVDQAIAANRTRICSFCARRDSITNLPTDGKEVADGDLILESIADTIDLEAAD